MAEEARLRINGREYPMPQNLTLGELADIEKITGQGYDLEKPGVRGMLAFAYVAVRRENKSVTIDDIRNLTPESLEMVGGDESPPALTTTASGSDSSTQTSDAGSSNGSEPSQEPTLEPTGSPV